MMNLVQHPISSGQSCSMCIFRSCPCWACMRVQAASQQGLPHPFSKRSDGIGQTPYPIRLDVDDTATTQLVCYLNSLDFHVIYPLLYNFNPVIVMLAM